MAADAIEVGDHVINLQVPGVFRVVARHGAFLNIESALGLRMTVSAAAVRKLADDAPPASGDA